MNRLHWNSSDHQHGRLSNLTLANRPVAGRRKPKWVRFCVGAMTGIMIMISNTAASAQKESLKPARIEKEGAFPGLDIWSVSQFAQGEAARREAQQLRAQQRAGQHQAGPPAAKQTSLIDVDQELVDQLAELRSSLGGGISPILGGVRENPQELEIIFVDEIKRLAKQQTQPQERQPQRPQMFHQQNRVSGQPVESERMLRPIEANLRDEPRRSTQNPETKAILRRSARLLEQAAAELEEASRFRDADQLRQQAGRLWRDAR